MPSLVDIPFSVGSGVLLIASLISLKGVNKRLGTTPSKPAKWDQWERGGGGGVVKWAFIVGFRHPTHDLLQILVLGGKNEDLWLLLLHGVLSPLFGTALPARTRELAGEAAAPAGTLALKTVNVVRNPATSAGRVRDHRLSVL